MLISKNLTKRVATSEGEILILSNISFELPKAQSLAIVGESEIGRASCRERGLRLV